MSEVRLLEELAANAWPAAVRQMVDGWQLRHTGTASRRVNSVLPNGFVGTMSLAEKVALVEAFYGRYQAPSRFQISTACQPADLDMILAERGYAIASEVQVQTAVTSTVLAHPISHSHIVQIAPELTLPWFTLHAQEAHLDETNLSLRRICLQNVPAPTAFATVFDNGRPIGIGRAVLERGWVGVFAMLTAPSHRRQGIAASILHALAQWAQDHQASQLYLQVLASNETAQALYAPFGFRLQYTYHFREKMFEAR